MKNEKRQYKFLEASWVLMVFTFIGVAILNAILVFKMQKALDLPKGEITGIFVAALILLVPILVSRLVSFSNTTVTLNKKEIQVNRSSLIGLPIKPDFHLPYSQIDSFVFQEDLNWYWLKIKDSKGRIYRVWKLGWIKNKEFKDFRDRLTNEISWFNKEMTNADQPEGQREQIKVAANIYQGTLGLILGVVSVIFLIAIPILLIVFGVPKLISLGPAVIGLSGAIFTFFKVWEARKN